MKYSRTPETSGEVMKGRTMAWNSAIRKQGGQRYRCQTISKQTSPPERLTIGTVKSAESVPRKEMSKQFTIEIEVIEILLIHFPVPRTQWMGLGTETMGMDSGK